MQITGTPTGDFSELAGGAFQGLAIRSDGTLVLWGGVGDVGVPAIPDELANQDFVAIAIGRFHAMAIHRDGSVASWGRNDNFGSDPRSVRFERCLRGIPQHPDWRAWIPARLGLDTSGDKFSRRTFRSRATRVNYSLVAAHGSSGLGGVLRADLNQDPDGAGNSNGDERFDAISVKHPRARESASMTVVRLGGQRPRAQSCATRAITTSPTGFLYASASARVGPVWLGHPGPPPTLWPRPLYLEAAG